MLKLRKKEINDRPLKLFLLGGYPPVAFINRTICGLSSS